MADFIRTVGDQVHSLISQLSDANGPLDIPVGTTVAFSGRPIGGSVATVGGTAVVVRAGARPDDPLRGVVRYDLSTTDMANGGLFYGRWILTPPGSSQVQSFPEDAKTTFLILGN